MCGLGSKLMYRIYGQENFECEFPAPHPTPTPLGAPG